MNTNYPKQYMIGATPACMLVLAKNKFVLEKFSTIAIEVSRISFSETNRI